ncbi:cyclic nucleotide-binding domain-containing protein [Labrenzia sp. 011]|uniref:cyclic nucleotide-binding domain-containing protein n=1 Tax=Labrenzia sp. 011 TaxID=2171494 RepID=UPI000D523855|nr:cyclic nucleotide-binding domain-containing protein [Labrenzia sp. 011]PVB62353.1 transcriptional regulator [Labrenzia sp. 011]
MRTTDMEVVRGLPLFRSMSEQAFDDLVQAAYVQNFPAQLDLIHEGEPADFLYVVLEGRVELYTNWNGRSATMGMVSPVTTFILAAVLKDAVCLMSARTCERCKLLLIPAANVRAAFHRDEAFSHAIIIELADCYRTVVKAHKNLKLRSGVERLANKLLHYHTVQGGTGRIVLPYDKKLLASMLAMTPENLSRAFNTLKPYGVEVNGAEITFTDLKGLETLAKPNPRIDDRQV